MNDKIEAATFVNYNEVPKPAFDALAELEQFICDLDGKTMATPFDDGKAFVDEGIVYANDAVKAFNVIVGELRSLALQPLRAREEIADAAIDTEKLWSLSEMLEDPKQRALIRYAADEIEQLRERLSSTAGQEWRDISSAPKDGSLAEKLRRRADEHEAKGDRKSKIIADELRAWAAEDVAK